MREPRRRTLADISGDPVADDALLDGLDLDGHQDLVRAAGPLLRDSTLLLDRAEHLASAYERRRERASPGSPTEQEAKIAGLLGFCLLTERMLACTLGMPSTAGRQGWNEWQRELNSRFVEPGVRGVFASLYGFPGRDLELASATVHRLGTTSFILKCRSRSVDAAGPSALKCLLYPYAGMRTITDATSSYATAYGAAAPKRNRRMVRVYRSTKLWVWMEFIEGQTLDEALGADRARVESRTRGLRSDLLRWYGLPLLEALAEVEADHLDLSPSNIMVRAAPRSGPRPSGADIVLIDFGQNYLLTHDVGPGRVSAETARYIAPELLESRARGRASGLEDVYSAGQILLELAGYDGSEGGFIPTPLYMDTPFVGRLIEDMLDRDPGRRLLLSRLDATSPVGGDRRRELFADLHLRLTQALGAHDVMAGMTPSLALQETAGSGWLGRIRATAGELSASFLLMVDTVGKPLQFRRVMKQGDEIGAQFGTFFRWAMICSLAWAICWYAVLKGIHDATQQVALYPDLETVVHAAPPFLDVGAIVRHYAPLPWAWPAGWSALPTLLVALTFGVTCSRYYLEIFSMLTVRRMPSTIGRLSTETLMRSTAIGAALVVPCLALFSGHWLLFWGVAMLVIVANNFANYQLARALVARGNRLFSTVRESDLTQTIEAFAEWYKLMLYYALVLIGLEAIHDLGLSRDIVLITLFVMVGNMLILYRGNCGRKAPGLRAALARAYATGERLESLRRRGTPIEPAAAAAIS
jgi:protein kinase-like protein